MRTLFLLLCLAALPLRAETTVTLLHFSDYHSHALPFYTDEGDRGGIARAVRYLAGEKRRGALVFNGGDTINKGAPAWSDKYRCVEWPWWNGIVDAMAFGNHDADYSRVVFDECRRAITYPIVSTNTAGLQRHAVFVVQGVRIGVFAIAGSDFPSLVKADGFNFGDPVAAARDVVRELRDRQHVDAVVMIGHEHVEDDYALAHAVPGIDLIFGSHSHLKRDFARIDGTGTWFISPFQYLAYISRVEMTFENRKLTGVRGNLIAVDRKLPEDRKVARRVRQMQRALEKDPEYRDLFKTIGHVDHPMTVRDLATLTLDEMRRAVHADVALSTVSSFRGALDRGPLTMEQLRAALPYDNEIVVCTMPAAALQRVLDFSASRTGTDSESFISSPASIDASHDYRVATTDYVANAAYREVFDCAKEKTGKGVRELVRERLAR